MTPQASATLVPGALNFRDVGGLPAGRAHVRRGVLYRSGNLAYLQDEGVAALRGLGIHRIIDLRADDEVAHAPSRIDGLDIATTRVPLFLGSAISFFEEDLSLGEMYRLLVDESAAGIVEVARGIVREQPVLVHCTVGKDRTGVTVALALAAAGVDEQAVIDDYARTEQFLPADRNRAVLERLRARHPDARHLEELATRSPAAAMSALLADVRTRFGSAGDYLRAHGMADDEIASLRAGLIER